MYVVFFYVQGAISKYLLKQCYRWIMNLIFTTLILPQIVISTDLYCWLCHCCRFLQLVGIVPSDAMILQRLGEMYDAEGDKSQAFQFHYDVRSSCVFTQSAPNINIHVMHSQSVGFWTHKEFIQNVYVHLNTVPTKNDIYTH